MDKAKYWAGVLYPENMIDNWENEIGDIVQVPYAYCVHDADLTSKKEERKKHVHLILVFPNTTTYNHAMNVFNLLSKQGCKAINTCQAIVSIRGAYDYLIHDTDSAKKQGKKLYDTKCRITGNNFDIGSYEQLSVKEKNELCKNLCNIIMTEKITNFTDFYDYCSTELFLEDSNYFDVFKSYSALFERLTKGNFQKYVVNKSQFSKKNTPKTHEKHTGVCPNCGSDDFRKNGKTVENKQRFRCSDCGKSWCEE